MMYSTGWYSTGWCFKSVDAFLVLLGIIDWIISVF